MKINENLKRLLDDHARFNSERARHEQMEVTLQAEESKLMDTVNLENKSEFEKVSQIRLRREIVPRKIKKFEQAAENTLTELADECGKTSESLLKIIRTKISNQVANIAKNLEPFFGSKSDAAVAALQIIFETSIGAKLIEPSNRLANSNFMNRPAIEKANELIMLCDAVESVEI